MAQKILVLTPGFSFSNALQQALKKKHQISFRNKRYIADAAQLLTAKLDQNELLLLTPCLGPLACSILLNALGDDTPTAIVQFSSAGAASNSAYNLADVAFATAYAKSNDQKSLFMDDFCRNILEGKLHAKRAHALSAPQIIENENNLKQCFPSSLTSQSCFEMEFSSVLRFGEDKKIPCIAIFIISDLIGKKRDTGFRSKEFRKTQENIAFALTEELVKIS